MVTSLAARLNSIEEACRNEFGRISSKFTSINESINVLIEALWKEMISTLCNCPKTSGDPKFSKIRLISKWTDSKENSSSLDNI
ncbi:hypothetical protein RhiirB3_433843 [Rhizophagus irregularis]|nr:hypothetical protein RhiirB3_433843 [Rhizophagus irregularis]